MKKITLALCLVLTGIASSAQSFDAIRAKATPRGTVLSKDTFVEGIIVSDYHSLNMAQNPQIAWDRIEERMVKGVREFKERINS